MSPAASAVSLVSDSIDPIGTKRPVVSGVEAGRDTLSSEFGSGIFISGTSNTVAKHVVHDRNIRGGWVWDRAKERDGLGQCEIRKGRVGTSSPSVTRSRVIDTVCIYREIRRESQHNNKKEN